MSNVVINLDSNYPTTVVKLQHQNTVSVNLAPSKIIEVAVGGGGSYTLTNSDASFSQTISADTELDDISVTKNDDSVVSYPAAKNIDIGVVDPFPSTFEEMRAAYGLGYCYPIETQTTSYRLGDAAWVEANIIGPARAANALKVKNEIDPTDPTKLIYNNLFGNKDRITDDSGTQVYANGIIVEHYIGMMFYVTSDRFEWNTQIDAAIASTQGGYTDWFLPSINIIMHISDHSTATYNLNYSPFNWSSNPVWSSTTVPGNTTSAYRTNISNDPVSALGKTSTSYLMLCRLI